MYILFVLLLKHRYWAATKAIRNIFLSFSYWAVTNVDYIHSRTSGRVTVMIVLVWTVSIIVSLAPQFGWKDPEYMQRIEQQKCMVSQDVAYQVI